ncbi:MAG: S8/S53 family peptidase [Gammaproteobacteria bacterium]|nr:S8/S53 family peptidase [Gammaproteobacteria bacterium]
MEVRAPRWGAACACLLSLLVGSVSLAQEAVRTIAHNTPRFVSTAKDLGPEETTRQISVYLWLQMHEADALRELLRQQYDPASPQYHVWLTRDEFNARFAPTSDEVAQARAFLAAHNLKPESVGERNLYVRASGTVENVQRAFNVQIHRFDVNGRVQRANVADPAVAEPVGSLVARVGGLSDVAFRPHAARATNPDTGQPFAAVPLAAVPDGAFFSANCFRPEQVVKFSTDGALPKAVYWGNRYGADITNQALGTLPPCGYQPSDIQTAYGLNPVYQAGLTGNGQTIVVVDAFGSPTIEADAGLFGAFYGLPLNLKVYVPYGIGSTTPGNAAGWGLETTLDVEWSHSIAPGANVALVIGRTDSFDDLGAAILYAVDHQLGNVIGNSYGSPEGSLETPPPTDVPAFEAILMAGAAAGISIDFSSGDSGDFYLAEGFTDVSYPASSPNATGVGGTSLALKPDGSIAFQTGWGHNLTRIATYQDAAGFNPPVVPPLFEGFVAGSGGGASALFEKPEFQRRLRGDARLVPDIAWLADSYTGVEVICTDTSCGAGASGQPVVGVVGGTSLSVQMFSGIWSLALERAGHPLGQAARMLYRLRPNAITDIVPVGSSSDATGFTLSDSGFSFYAPWQLVPPVETRTPFYSALYNGVTTRWYALSFGTDSSLFTARGWDDVTGLGTPNGWEFIEAVARHRDHDR